MGANERYGYFFAGLSLGAALGLLFAPKSGAETRNYLQSRAEDATQRFKDQAQQTMDRVTENIDRGHAMVRDQAESLSTAIEVGVRAYRGG